MSVIFIGLKWCCCNDRFCFIFPSVSFPCETFLQSAHCHFRLRTSAVAVSNCLCQQHVDKFLALTNTFSRLIQLEASVQRGILDADMDKHVCMTLIGMDCWTEQSVCHNSYVRHPRCVFYKFGNVRVRGTCCRTQLFLLAIWEAYNNYMFRPYPWAIIRLYQRSLRLS